MVSAIEAQADARHGFEFRRLIIDRTGIHPEACFRFSRVLDDRAEVHYGDYFKTEPAASLAVRAVNTDLCVAGLAEGTSYKMTLAAGVPLGGWRAHSKARDGRRFVGRQVASHIYFR